MAVLPLRIHHDGLLSVLAPLGAALAGDTALVIDLHPAGPALPGHGAGLASMIETGPTAADLAPSRRGVAVIHADGADPRDAEPVVAAFAQRWPLVVLRLGPGETWQGRAVDVVPVFGRVSRAAVYQPTGLVSLPENLPGVVLPSLRPGVAKALMAGRRVRGRWVRAWRDVWEAAA